MFKSDNELDNFVNNIKFDACASGNNDDLQKSSTMLLVILRT